MKRTASKARMEGESVTFELKVQQIDAVCLFELTWGMSQRLQAQAPYSKALEQRHGEWRCCYRQFSQRPSPPPSSSLPFNPSQTRPKRKNTRSVQGVKYDAARTNPLANPPQNDFVRGRVDAGGTGSLPEQDWRSQLAQATAALLHEFQRWLDHGNLAEIRAEIVRAALKDTPQPLDIYVSCGKADLEKLPWESWQIGTQLGIKRVIRIARTAAQIRHAHGSPRPELLTEPLNSGKALSSQRSPAPQPNPRRARILAILGDDTGLNFQADRAALASLSHLAQVTFVGWQAGQDNHQLRQQITDEIAAPPGWDILFFAGHSNETLLTGGELAIAPGDSILLCELLPALTQAKAQGLQFALFNSCSGLSIANQLIDLGLNQVAIMREPINNSVAQLFLWQFVQALSQFEDVHGALRAACHFLQLERDRLYPAAYLVPSLFCYPGTPLFRLRQTNSIRQRLSRLALRRSEAFLMAGLTVLSLLPPVQTQLLESRGLIQAMYRAAQGHPHSQAAPIRIIQIDAESFNRAGITTRKPISQAYLAQLIDRLVRLNPSVIGVDYVLDLPHQEQASLKRSLQQASPTQAFVFAAIPGMKLGEWDSLHPNLTEGLLTEGSSTEDLKTQVSPQSSSIQTGNTWFPHWYIVPAIPPNSQLTQPAQPDPQPFGYQMAALHKQAEVQANAAAKAEPDSPSQRPYLQPWTQLSYILRQHWLQPLLDFSLSPTSIYQVIPAWSLLESSEQALQESGFAAQPVIIAAGGYAEAGIKDGEDSLPLLPALEFWRIWDRNTNQSLDLQLTGGEVIAYATHHALTQHYIIPIPDLWILWTIATFFKTFLLIKSSPLYWPRWGIGLLILGYGLLSLQLYITAELLLPWLLPTCAFVGFWKLNDSHVPKSISRP